MNKSALFTQETKVIIDSKSLTETSQNDKQLRTLLVGSPSIKVPELEELWGDSMTSITKMHQNPLSGADVIGSMITAEKSIGDRNFQVLYSDNDLTRFRHEECSLYFKTAFNLLDENGIFVCSCFDVSVALSNFDEMSMNDQIDFGSNVIISPAEVVFGNSRGSDQEIDVYSVRSSFYNARELADLAITSGFVDASVHRISEVVLVLVAAKGGINSDLPKPFRRWIEESFRE